jgi:hypothetical protein
MGLVCRHRRATHEPQQTDDDQYHGRHHRQTPPKRSRQPLQGQPQSQHDGNGAGPEGRHHQHPRPRATGAGGEDRERVEPAAGKQRGEQSEQQRPGHRRSLSHQAVDAGAEAKDEAWQRNGRDRKVERLDQRVDAPDDHQRTGSDRGDSLHASHRTGEVYGSAEWSRQGAKQQVGGQPATVVSQVGQVAPTSTARLATRIEGHEAAAHSGAVQAAGERRHEYRTQQRRVHRQYNSSTVVWVNRRPARVTSKRNSHKPGRRIGSDAE